MPVPLPQGETLWVLQPGAPTRDSAGNYVPGPDMETPIEGCAVWPTGSTEDTDTRDQTAERLSVLVPAGTAVEAISRVKVWGHVYNVDGEPLPWRSPLTGTSAGIELRLGRVSG